MQIAIRIDRSFLAFNKVRPELISRFQEIQDSMGLEIKARVTQSPASLGEPVVEEVGMIPCYCVRNDLNNVSLELISTKLSEYKSKPKRDRFSPVARNTLPTVIAKINTPVFPDLVFKSVTYKDFDEKLFKRKVDITPLFNEIMTHVKTKKKHITFDYKEFTPVAGETSKTCASTDWHVDGFDNEYYIVCFGKNRTEFLTSEIKLIQKKDLWLKNHFINKSVKESKDGMKSFEALNGVLYKYNSKTVHRGREVEVKSMDEAAANGRILVRICCSDYITAKNHIKR